MNTPKLVTALHEARIRVDQLIWLGAAMIEATCSGPLDDFLYDPADLQSAFPEMTDEEAERCTEGSALEKSEEFLDWLGGARSCGFLAYVSTPHPDGDSWGYMRTAWIFGDTLEGIVGKAVSWGEKVAQET